MAKKRKALKPEAKVPVDPKATVFQVGDEIVVQRRVMWTGYFGVVESVDGGMCRVRLASPSWPQHTFPTNIPAIELKLIL